jgi:hypothetical protein
LQVTVKEKVIRAINNRLDTQQHGARRKLARNAKKNARKQIEANKDGLDSSILPAQGDNVNDGEANNSLMVEVDEQEAQEVEQFKARRLVNSKKKLSTKAMLQQIPDYNNFETVSCSFVVCIDAL